MLKKIINILINYLVSLAKNILKLNSFRRKIVLILIDLFLVLTSQIFIIYFFLEPISAFGKNYLWIIYLSFPFSILFYLFLGQHKAILRYSGNFYLYNLILRNFLLLISTFLFGKIFLLTTPSLIIWILLLIVLTFFTTLGRFVIRDSFLYLTNINQDKRIRVAIYGAGSAGAQLAAALSLGNKYKIINFIDDSTKLQKRNLLGIPIISKDKIDSPNLKIDQILLAIPSLTSNKRKIILENLEKFNKPVFLIPSIEELSCGEKKIDTLNPIKIDDLIGRELINPYPELLYSCIENSVVCVTGAGGSIGSELCRQIIALNPSKLILIERSEVALYQINQEISKLIESKNISLVAALGCCKNEKFVKEIFQINNVKVVFHAAAYKHVPIVENNPLQGISNNIFSTKVICECSSKTSVEKMILISTDKSVRPTNVMGATKRISELIVQVYAKKFKSTNKNISFSMVRFGNVLGSSGSVVPLFEKQIFCGGPVTITHKDVVRYFMTIEEAAQLVIQSASLAKGGEVFLLDMGKPLKILDLAEKMIRLSGQSIKNDSNPEGQIEIKITGLRPGEKLYEELLIDAKSEKTKHPLIFKAKEKLISEEILFNKLKQLKSYVEANDKDKCLDELSSLLPEWKRSIK